MGGKGVDKESCLLCGTGCEGLVRYRVVAEG